MKKYTFWYSDRFTRILDRHFQDSAKPWVQRAFEEVLMVAQARKKQDNYWHLEGWNYKGEN